MFSTAPRVLNTNNGRSEYHFKILSLLRASSSVPSTKNPSQCQCMNSRKNEEIGCWCSYLILRGWIPAPPRTPLLIPCGLAAVEGRPVNEEITINRFLSSLPQSSHGRVWNPTMIPAVLTRPILSQIIMNYLVKLYFILSVYNLLRSGGKTLDTSSTIHGVQNCLGEMKCQT